MQRLLLSLVAWALLSSCGGGGTGAGASDTPAPVSELVTLPPSPPQDAAVCSVAGQRLSVRGFMEDRYFWYAQRGVPDNAAANMDAYFRSLLNLPTDRYSYSESTAAFNQVFSEGVRIGYGYTLTWGDAGQTQLRVRNVVPRSPVARAGLVRGDQVLSIDGFTPAQIVAGTPGAVSVPGVARSFRVRAVSGGEKSFTVHSEEFPLSPVQATATFEVTRSAEAGGGSVKVGYLAYEQFVRYSVPDLRTAMQAFGSAGVRELVLDLRYNGGGEVNVARDLAAMIGGARVRGKLFAYLRFNDKHAASNQSVVFDTPDALPPTLLPNLSRVVVIASRSTASASELLVNGLRPFMEVVLVGDSTFGKPYGFEPRDYCGTTYNAVNFQALNAEGFGSYTEGLPPTCAAGDDLDHALGDASERRTRAALDYIATGRCAQAPQRTAGDVPPAAPAFGETLPSRMVLR